MIDVYRPDPDDNFGERCCFCRSLTTYWIKEKDVACCQKCAKTAKLTNVPSKKKWLKKEDDIRRKRLSDNNLEKEKLERNFTLTLKIKGILKEEDID